ncbi:segment polarity protein dishevelled homolog DVL-3-like isoform X2 [Salvelinus fontinalis]|uniref:segment polarity protein dishevelled homolog DVL-3-like isoform X2 n=1 Tax=Salvelinus fontinalis TaxID=8038 RepID=UPI0024853B4C|nr:segment polarity protein dishevelled homolog DVL-3-like isoform X2 [Salvelinus fontinalis]
MGETKVIYHLDDQETPYLVKLAVPADRVTLADFKNVLKKPNYKFFFKSMDDDFGVVKEEISDDNAKLPCFNGRVVSWLVSGDGAHSDSGSVVESLSELPPPPLERTGGIGESRPPSYHGKATGERDSLDNETETGSMVSQRRARERPRRKHTREHGGRNGYSRVGRGAELGQYDSCSSFMSSELESTSCFDSEDDDATSRFSSSTEQSSSRLMRRHRRRRRKPKTSNMERSSSFSSVTDSTMSLNIITVTLNMEKYNFLGISIVGQSNERGDGGIYIGSIMKGGAVAADGRIEPGDMLLQVNDINFENMNNDDAVRVLRDIVHKPGPITLTVAKCWDPNPRSCFALPRSEPIRPIDPAAWVSHTAAMTGVYPAYGMSPSMSTVTSTSSSIGSSVPETERFDDFHLSIHSDMSTVAKAMASPESGLEVRDRMWLKITIANAFIGSDVVDWLFHHMEGFSDRREARKYASNLLKAGYIRHTVNKITFSEQCYYTFGDLCGNMTHLSLHDHDGSSGGASDQDTLPPLPHPGAAPWPMSLPYQFSIAHPYNPQPQHDLPQGFPGVGAGSAGSQHSEGSSGSNCSKTEGRGGAGGSNKSGGSGSESEIRSHRVPSERSVAPSERSIRSSYSHRSAHSSHSLAYSPGLVYGPPGLPPNPPHLATAAPGAPPGRQLANAPPELTGSRQSLRMAVGNRGEFFVDVM